MEGNIDLVATNLNAEIAGVRADIKYMKARLGRIGGVAVATPDGLEILLRF